MDNTTNSLSLEEIGRGRRNGLTEWMKRLQVDERAHEAVGFKYTSLHSAAKSLGYKIRIVTQESRIFVQRLQ